MRVARGTSCLHSLYRVTSCFHSDTHDSRRENIMPLWLKGGRDDRWGNGISSNGLSQTSWGKAPNVLRWIESSVRD